MPKRPAGENLKQYQAFEYWFWLDHRAWDKVAAACGVSEGTIRLWQEKFRWQERAEERAAQLKAKLADRNDSDAVAAQAKLLRIADATLARYAARLLKRAEDRAAHDVTQYEPTAADAARWAQMRLLLTGQATSRSELTVGAGFVDAFLATVKGVLRRAIPRCCPTCKTDLDLPEKIGAALMEASAKLAAEQGGARPEPPAPRLTGGPADDRPDEAGPDA